MTRIYHVSTNLEGYQDNWGSDCMNMTFSSIDKLQAFLAELAKEQAEEDYVLEPLTPEEIHSLETAHKNFYVMLPVCWEDEADYYVKITVGEVE